MSKLFITGTGPLLEEGVRMIGGQCLRTWHFAQPLLAAGHEVVLCTVPIPDKARPWQPGQALTETCRYGDFEYRAFAVNDPARVIPALEELIEDARPDALIGVNTFPAQLLARTRSRLPLWADLNGWHLVEGHMHAVRQGSDDFLRHFWEQERAIVRRADKFSTVSERQRLALIGELAFCGRLGHRAAGYDFAHAVPNAVNEMLMDAMKDADGAKPEARGPLAPENAFIALWSGGFNAWTDVRLLFEGLSAAMAERPEIHFVSTGGAVEGYDEKTYAEFQALVGDSPLRGRFHLLGWIDAGRLPQLYREADIGLNLDAVNYETLFGGRNRLTNMMACGLCPCTTLGTEIADDIRREGLGLTFANGSAEAFRDALLAGAADRAALRGMGQRAREFALREWSYAATTRAVAEWAAAPALAPDNAERLRLAASGSDKSASGFSNLPLNDVERFMDRPTDLDVEELLQNSADLHAMRQKPIFKMWKSLKRLLGGR